MAALTFRSAWRRRANGGVVPAMISEHNLAPWSAPMVWPPGVGFRELAPAGRKCWINAPQSYSTRPFERGHLSRKARAVRFLGFGSGQPASQPRSLSQIGVFRSGMTVACEATLVLDIGGRQSPYHPRGRGRCGTRNLLRGCSSLAFS